MIVNVHRAALLNANQRLHWREKARRAKMLRINGYAAAWAVGRKPFEHRVRCHIEVQWPDFRRRDVHNLMPTIKPIIDGIVDASMLVDDSDKWMVGPDLRVSDRLCDQSFACSLFITFEPVA